MEKPDTSKEKILQASWDEFVDMGYSGARMQRIADKAGVNKAMIYYYFSSKDSLFENLLKTTFEKFFSVIFADNRYEDMSFEQLVREFVDRHIEFLQKNPQIPKVLIRELHSKNPITTKVIRKLFVKLISGIIEQVKIIFNAAIEKGEIRPVDPMQTMWNIAGMNLFFFFLKPVLELLIREMDLEEEQVLQERKQAIVDMILYGLVPRETVKENL